MARRKKRKATTRPRPHLTMARAVILAAFVGSLAPAVADIAVAAIEHLPEIIKALRDAE